MTSANLSGANLIGVNLADADLTYADLSSVASTALWCVFFRNTHNFGRYWIRIPCGSDIQNPTNNLRIHCILTDELEALKKKRGAVRQINYNVFQNFEIIIDRPIELQYTRQTQ